MTTPMIAVARGLQVMPHVEPRARLANERPSPAIRPTPPNRRYRIFPLAHIQD